MADIVITTYQVPVVVSGNQGAAVAVTFPPAAVVTVQPGGIKGDQGIPGPSALGFIDYSDTDSSVLTLAPNTRTWITRSAPTALSFAQPPFVGAVLWDGQKIRGRVAHDTMVMRLDLMVRPLVSGGALYFGIDIGLGTDLDPDSKSFAGQTGVSQPMRFLAPLDFRTYLMANGGKIMLSSTVPCEISRVSPEFFLWGAGP